MPKGFKYFGLFSYILLVMNHLLRSIFVFFAK